MNDSNTQTALSTLQSQLSALQNSKVMALEPYLDVSPLGGNARITLTGVNLQIVNGLGTTNSVNGWGNLIIGYDAARNDNTYFCSD